MDYLRTHDAAGHVECSCRRWIDAPAVAAARMTAETARAAWNATELPFGVTRGLLTAEQHLLRRRMEASDRAYVVARDDELSRGHPGRSWEVVAPLP